MKTLTGTDTVALFLLSTTTISNRLSGIHAFAQKPTRPFSGSSVDVSSVKQSSTRVGVLRALSERQMQFWEDVGDGLDDIEKFYEAKGQQIDRIREFAKSARREIPFPKGQAPLHKPSEENVEGLTAKPFWDDIASDHTNFPWASELESNFETILKEFESNLLSPSQQQQQEEQSKNIFAGDSAWQNQVMGEGWSAFRLQRLGAWNGRNCKRFPETYELLRKLEIPFAVRGVCFARQSPGSGVAPHTDGRNFILTSHLGLKIPDDCWIQVGNEKKTWQVGKLTTVDTSFEHSTGNPNAEEDRYVLIIDFWHPELTEAERAGLEFVYDLRNKFENGEVPIRKPRSLVKKDGGFWSALVGGK